MMVTKSMDEIQYAKRIAETITKLTVIDKRKNNDSEERVTATEEFRVCSLHEGKLVWDSIEGDWRATSTLDDWEANIQSYMDSTRTQKSEEEDWVQRKHYVKNELFNIELEVSYLKSEIAPARSCHAPNLKHLSY